MAKRKTRRKKNPTTMQWVLIGVGAIAAGASGYGVYHYVNMRHAQKALQKLPPPPTDFPAEPQLVPEGSGEPVPSGGCGAQYPGFALDGDACVPTEKTPGGIYVDEACADFVFIAKDQGPQVDYLENLINEEADRTKDPGQPSADPTELATEFFQMFWGQCTWPPQAHGSPRIVQLYQAIVFVIGNSIVADGGRVLGTTDPDLVQEQIAELIQEMGFADFDPSAVPEIKIPDALPEPVTLPPLVGTKLPLVGAKPQPTVAKSEIRPV